MPVPGQTPEAPATAPTKSFAEQVSVSSFGGTDLLKSQPNSPFFLVHFAENWEVDDEGLEEPTWLPQLQRDWVEPGCNAKVTRKTGMPVSMSFDTSHRQLARRGATILPQKVALEGFAYDTYLCELDVQHPRTGAPGKMYFDRWETPLAPREGKRVKFQRDRGEYNRWRRALVEQGFIAAPDPDLLGEAVGRAAYHLDRHALKTDVPEDQRQRMVAEAKAKLERIGGAAIPRKQSGALVDQAPAPKRPPVAELREQVAAITSQSTLQLLLHGEDRPRARQAIEERIEELRRAESFAEQAGGDDE
jgi:hypothetical protein